MMMEYESNVESSPEDAIDVPASESHEPGLPACINCRRSKVRCEGAELPCKRCIRLCWAATCARPEPQKRGRKKKSAAGTDPSPSPPGSKASLKKSSKSTKSINTTAAPPSKPRKRPVQPLLSVTAQVVAPSVMNFNPIFSPSTDGSISSGTFQILTPGSGEFCIPSQPPLHPRSYAFEAPHPLRKAYSHSSLLSGTSPFSQSEASSPALSSGSVFSPTFHTDPSAVHQFSHSLHPPNSHAVPTQFQQYQQVIIQPTQPWNMQQQQQQQIHIQPTSSDQFSTASGPAQEFMAPVAQIATDPIATDPHNPTQHMLQASGAFSSASTPQRLPTDLAAVSPSPPAVNSKVALPPAPEVIQSIFGAHTNPLPQLLLDTSISTFPSTSSAVTQSPARPLNSESIVSSFRSAHTLPELIDSDDIVAVPKSHTRAIHPRYSAFRRSCQENVEQFGFLESHFNTWRNVVSSDHTMFSDRSAVLRFLWFASHVSLVVHDFCVLNGIDLNVTSLRHPALPTASSALFSIVPSDSFGQPLGPIYPKSVTSSAAHHSEHSTAASSSPNTTSETAVALRSTAPSASSSLSPFHSIGAEESDQKPTTVARDLLQKVERQEFIHLVQNRGVPLIRLLEKPQFQSEFKQLAQMFMRHVFRGVDAVLQMASPHLEGELSFPVVESGGGFQFAVEKQAFKQLPMGVIAIPLFPRPFVPDRGKATPVYAWANRNACALLGYQPEEMAELLSTRDGFLSLCHPGTYFEVSRRFCHALTHHIKQLTFVSDWIHKSGKSISLVGTRWFKYDQGLPILQIIFLQPLPTTVIPPFETHRPRSPHAYSFSTMSPRSDGHDHEHDHEHEAHSVAASPHIHGTHDEAHQQGSAESAAGPPASSMGVDPISQAIDLYSTTFSSLANSNGQVDSSLASSMDGSAAAQGTCDSLSQSRLTTSGSSESLPSLTGGLLSASSSESTQGL